MKARTRLGLGVLEAGILLGLLGDALLRAESWGVNVPLWVGALAASAAALARRAGMAGARDGRWLLPCALAFAAAFAWRDSTTLRALDAAAILALLGLALLRARGGLIRRAGVTDYAAAWLVSALSATFGSLLLLLDEIEWREVAYGRWLRQAVPVLRGLVIALPLVLVFGALFVAADAAYEGLVNRAFTFDPGVITSHALLFLLFAWLSAGFLRGMFLGGPATPLGGRPPAYFLLGLGVSDRAEAARREAARPPAAGADVAEPSHVSAVEPGGACAAKEASGETEEACAAKDEAVAAAKAAGAVKAGDAVASEDRPEVGADAAGVGAATPGAGFDAAAAFFSGVSEAPRRAAAAAQGEAPRTGRGAAGGAGRTGVSLGVVEVGVVLGLLNALFFSFVAVQLRYLFGGAGVVLDPAGPTYSEYARRGFFELVWVAALVLPLLLAAHWLLRKENPAHERVFRALAGGLLVMLFVIMASAVGRMRLYQSEYGQTELRFYTTAFMGWLALVFVWFALTALRGARERFACGALVAALVVVAALHVVNPNAHIVRTNAALAGPGRGFDAPYAASLGADAVPALIAALPELSPPERARLALRLLEWDGQSQGDWRGWNWSHHRARRAVAENEAMLREWAKWGRPAPPALEAALTPNGPPEWRE